jgi:maleylpyruvate isomerase
MSSMLFETGKTAGMVPQLDLAGVRGAHARLLDSVASLTDVDVAQPSRLPQWTVGHVLTHLARNADSHRGMFAAAARGEVGDQYPGGAEQRSADIESGASRSAADLVADVRSACAALERAWDSASDAAWAAGEGRLMKDGTVPLTELVFRRWREVEVHHADLGLSFGWRDWSDEYVDLELDQAALRLAERLPDEMAVRLEPTDAIGAWIIETLPRERVVLRASRHELLAWMLDRHERPDWPELTPW